MPGRGRSIVPRFGLKQFVKRNCPPTLLRALRWLCRPALRAFGRAPRVVTTLEALDRELARAEQAAQVSHDAFLQALTEFRFEPPRKLPRQPYSAQYRAAQMELYHLLSGRDSYSPAANEQSDIDVGSGVACPYPYATRSSRAVGEQLMAIGFLIRALDLAPGGRILEFGPGWGNTTLELARMGYAVTAVDVEPKFLTVIRERAARLGVAVDLACADMLAYRPARGFDRVLFYECFHHCADHVRLVEALDGLVAEGGAVIFAAEPIEDHFPLPWGLRCDGLSVWSIRKYGWLELGFRTAYFVDLLARHGWVTQRLDSQDVAWQRVFVARRTNRRRSAPRAA
jgi:2-polyprenyl-3-methyl-5-hydroxy-6-metoxy-1,4-benzoquinol methylase